MPNVPCPDALDTFMSNSVGKTVCTAGPMGGKERKKESYSTQWWGPDILWHIQTKQNHPNKLLFISKVVGKISFGSFFIHTGILKNMVN